VPPPPRHHHPRARHRDALRLTPSPALVVSTEIVCASLRPRVHPVSCPGCAFDGGGEEAPVTSVPTAAWQRGMRPISL
jgi:hypothetical protein